MREHLLDDFYWKFEEDWEPVKNDLGHTVGGKRRVYGVSNLLESDYYIPVSRLRLEHYLLVQRLNDEL